MFGFSLTKLLVLVAIIAVVWYGFKLLSRRQVRRAVRARDAGRAVQDMAKCAVCGDYVATACRRSDCPKS